MASNANPNHTVTGDLAQVLLHAVEQSHSLVIVTDLKGAIRYVNPKCCELTGFTREEILDRNIRLMKSGQMDAEFYGDLWKSIRENGEWRGEFHNRKKSGEFYWESAVISAISDDDGNVEYYLKVAEDITRLKEAEEHRDKLMAEMRVMAMQDTLTGLYSRRMFNDELNRAWKTGERQEVSTGLLVIDIDYFKTFNDTYGHQIGDRVLVEASQLIKETARAGDIVCRYGGDEIVVILPRATLDAVSHVGSRLLQAFRSHVFCEDSHRLKVTVSIGAAACTSRGQPAHTLMLSADNALYHAKQNGRNILSVADPGSATPFLLVGEAGGELAMEPDSTTHVLLLVADPEKAEPILKALPDHTFTVTTASEIEEGLSIVRRHVDGTDVVLLDADLMTEDENDPLKRIWLVDDAISAVLIAGSADGGRIAATGRGGSVGIVTRPIAAETLLPALAQAVKHRHYSLEERRYRRHLQDMVLQRSEKIEGLLQETVGTNKPVAEMMKIILNAYERKTGEHCQRVEEIARILAGEMNLTDEDRDAIERGAFLHDIGKLGIPDSILLKETPLTLEEWKTVRLHPQIGYDLLKDQQSFEKAALIVLEHHERYDGSGYPDSKRGDQISVGARIFAIADAYDAMRTDRPYSKGITPEMAAEELKASSGTLFDPQAVEAFLEFQPVIEARVYSG